MAGSGGRAAQDRPQKVQTVVVARVRRKLGGESLPQLQQGHVELGLASAQPLVVRDQTGVLDRSEQHPLRAAPWPIDFDLHVRVLLDQLVQQLQHAAAGRASRWQSRSLAAARSA